MWSPAHAAGLCIQYMYPMRAFNTYTQCMHPVCVPKTYFQCVRPTHTSNMSLTHASNTYIPCVCLRCSSNSCIPHVCPTHTSRTGSSTGSNVCIQCRAPSQGSCSEVMKPFLHPHPRPRGHCTCAICRLHPAFSCPDFLLGCFRRKISPFFSQGHREGKCISTAPGWMDGAVKTQRLGALWTLDFARRAAGASPCLCISSCDSSPWDRTEAFSRLLSFPYRNSRSRY